MVGALVDLIGDFEGRSFCFSLTIQTGRVYYFVVADEEEAEQWVSHINLSIRDATNLGQPVCYHLYIYEI